MVDLGCLGTALVEVLGGEVDLEVDGFGVYFRKALSN